MERLRLAYRKFDSEKLTGTQLAMWLLITIVSSFYALNQVMIGEWPRWAILPATLISFVFGLFFVIASGKAAMWIRSKRNGKV